MSNRPVTVLAVITAAAVIPAAAGQTLFSDTFSDGDDAGWTRYAMFGDYGQRWSVVNGEYRLRSLNNVPNTGGPGLVSAWAESQNDGGSYEHGTIRSKVRIISAGASAGVFLRSDMDFSCYAFILSDTANGGILYSATPEDGLVDLGRISIPGGVTPGIAYWVEGGAVGPTLSFKIWRDGDAEPAEPQLVRRDTRITRPGIAGLYTYLSGLWPVPAMIDARFDDVGFTRVAYCPVDFNHDGFSDFFDYDDFIAAFETGDMASDFNNDGFLDFFDYDDFVAAFEVGC